MALLLHEYSRPQAAATSKEDLNNMHARNTSVLARSTVAALLAIAPITASAQQRPGGQRNDQENERQTRSAGLTVPVEGSVGIEGDQNPAPLTGTFAIRQFARAGGSVVAVGTLTATYTPGSGSDASAIDAQASGARTIVTQISLPVSSGGVSEPQPTTFDSPRFTSTPQARQTGCDALHIALGPAEMTLLQLNVTLEPIALDIAGTAATATRTGNAGDLQSVLCAIASQSNRSQQGQASSVVDLLNQLLDLLG